MSGFTGYPQTVTAFAAGQEVHQSFMNPMATMNAGSWMSGFTFFSNPPAGVDPASTPGTAFSSGGINFPDRSGLYKTLARLEAVSSSAGVLMVVDRLVGVGSIVTTSTGDKTVNSTALTRYTSGENVWAWIEATTAINSGCTLSLSSYTDSAGGTGKSGPSLAVPTGLSLHTMMMLPVANDSLGIKSVETVNVSAASVTTGAANIVLIRPIAHLYLPANAPRRMDFILENLSFNRINDGACLDLMFYNPAATTPSIRGKISAVYN